MDEVQRCYATTALKLGLLSEDQFAAATHHLVSDPHEPLGPWLVAQGWLDDSDAARVRQILIEQLLATTTVCLQDYSGMFVEHFTDAESGAHEASNNALTVARNECDEFELDSSACCLEDPCLEDAPDLTAGRYELGRMLVEGGLSRIWVAQDKRLHRKVAVKQLRPELKSNTIAQKRFRREAQITGQLEHPNIVPVYDLGGNNAESGNFYAMRLVKGRTLRAACDEYHISRSAGINRPLDMLRLLQAFVSVCQAIAYANSRGIIHRDLKPENVILGKFGEVVVLDWGLAKVIGEPDDEGSGSNSSRNQFNDILPAHQTAIGQVLGTPAYMAPEQANPIMGIDQRTDVYGLGSTLFVILTGTPPHRGPTVTSTLTDVRQNPVRRACEVNPFVPFALDTICAKATAYSPEDRYESAADLASDIEKYLADEPIEGVRDSLATRVRRLFNRNRIRFAAVMSILPAVTLALLIVLFVMIYRLNVSEAARRELEDKFRAAQQDNRFKLTED